MASNHTTNFNLSQWEENDEVLRTDFNADNLKLDAALSAAESGIAAVSAEAAKRGNCVVMAGTYTGSGKYGYSSPTYLSFAHKPMIVLVDGLYIMVNGQSSAEVMRNGFRYIVYTTWGERSVSWYGTEDDSWQCSSAGTHKYVALLDQEN